MEINWRCGALHEVCGKVESVRCLIQAHPGTAEANSVSGDYRTVLRGK